MASLLGAAASGGREYVLKIVADVKDATKGIDDVATKTTTMRDKMVGIGKSVATGLAVGAVVEFGRQTVMAAADADDALDAIDAAFGASAKVIEDYSKTTAESMGLSADQYQLMAAKTGNLLQSVGISADDAAESTIALSERAADMAAIWGTSTEEAMNAITKGLTGSTKPLQQFGVKISSAEIEARAMAKGYTDAAGKVTDAGKAIAAQELILEKTQNVQGAFADNSKDLGSQQDILAAKFRNLQTEIGSKLLPIIVQLMSAVQPLLDFVVQNISWLAPLAGIIAGIAAALKLWAIAQAALNLVMMANPIMLVVAAIAALTAAIIWAYNNVGWFRDAVDAMADAVVAAFNWILDIVKGVFNWIKNNWPLLVAIITGPFGTAVYLIKRNWDTIIEGAKWVWQNIQHFFGAVYDAITWPFKRAAEWVKGFWDGMTGWAKSFVTNLEWFFGRVADIITWPFKKAIEAIKWLWNSTIGGFGFSVPSWIPGLGGKQFRIPEMAMGGIVTRPTVALIGEAGREAVIPLDRGGGLPTATAPVIHVHVNALNANSETGRLIAQALREYQRTTGSTLLFGAIAS